MGDTSVTLHFHEENENFFTTASRGRVLIASSFYCMTFLVVEVALTGDEWSLAGEMEITRRALGELGVAFSSCFCLFVMLFYVFAR